MPTDARSIADVLASTSLLRTAAPGTIDALAAASRRRVLERDEVLFVHGDRPQAVYAVASGTLRVFTTSFAGDEPTFNLLEEGALLGELGVLDDVPRSASAAALRRSELVEVPAHAFRTAYDADPAIARRLVALLSDRLRALSDGLADLTALDLGGRLAKYLLGEADRQGSTAIALTLTQAQLGQVLGAARQSVNQAMQALERAGLVALKGRTVRVLDTAALRVRDDVERAELISAAIVTWLTDGAERVPP